MPLLRFLTARRPRPFMLLLLLLFGMPAVLLAQDLTKWTVAYSSRSIAPIDYFIGEQYGFFKAEGLDVRLVQIRANVAVIATLASEVDVLGSITTAISAAQRGAPIKILAVALHRPLFWLVARPEFKNISDLKARSWAWSVLAARSIPPSGICSARAGSIPIPMPRPLWRAMFPLNYKLWLATRYRRLRSRRRS
jgi:NMT1/THI5 like